MHQKQNINLLKSPNDLLIKNQKRIFSQIFRKMSYFHSVHTLFQKTWDFLVKLRQMRGKNSTNEPFRLIVSVELNISMCWRFAHHVEPWCVSYRVIESGKWERKMLSVRSVKYSRYVNSNDNTECNVEYIRRWSGEKHGLVCMRSTTDYTVQHTDARATFRMKEIISLRIVNRFSDFFSAPSNFHISSRWKVWAMTNMCFWR